MSSSVEDFKAKFAGQRVKFVGMFGNTDGPVAKVWRVTSRGVCVTFGSSCTLKTSASSLGLSHFSSNIKAGNVGLRSLAVHLIPWGKIMVPKMPQAGLKSSVSA